MGKSSTKKNQCKLAVMFTLNFGFFLVELIVGYWTNSMALVADSFHMLSDVAALVVAFFAVKLSPKKWSKNTYGWARAEVLGALVNSVFLIALCFTIVVESIQRIIEPMDITNIRWVLIVGSIGLLMNLVGLCIFQDRGHSHHHGHDHSHEGGTRPEGRASGLTHSNRLTRMVSTVEVKANEDDDDDKRISFNKVDSNGGKDADSALVASKRPKKGPTTKITVEDDHLNVTGEEQPIGFTIEQAPKKKGGGHAEQMNIRGVFLHILADAMGSVIVVVSALVYEYTDWEYKMYIDPGLSICMVILILMSVYSLLVESSLILLQSVPDHIDLDALEKKLLKQIDGVIGIHELHVWQLAGDKIIATAHIKCRTLQEYFYIAEKVKVIFHNEGIHSTTIQPEFSQQNPDLILKDNTECLLSCSALSTTTNCSANTCCPPPQSSAMDSSSTILHQNQNNHNV